MRDLKAYNTLLDMLFLSFMEDLNIQGTILIHTQRGVLYDFHIFFLFFLVTPHLALAVQLDIT